MWVGKRIFDFSLALVAFILLSPIFFVIAAWIKLEGHGPVFFRQKRIGLNGVPFFIHKFRTMYVDAEKRRLKITVGNDSQITPSGSILRKYKIDEFPQLIDVLLGKMSLVGPRPEVPEYVEKYPLELRKKIFKMRPGITDWASIKFKDENLILGESVDPEKTYIEEILPIKLFYYENYFKTASLPEDLKIIFYTFLEVFGKRSVV